MQAKRVNEVAKPTHEVLRSFLLTRNSSLALRKSNANGLVHPVIEVSLTSTPNERRSLPNHIRQMMPTPAILDRLVSSVLPGQWPVLLE
jgi:hypothetical protein